MDFSVRLNESIDSHLEASSSIRCQKNYLQFCSHDGLERLSDDCSRKIRSNARRACKAASLQALVSKAIGNSVASL